MDLARKMTRAELNELNVEERKERLRLQNVNKSRKYKERNETNYKTIRSSNKCNGYGKYQARQRT